MKRILKMIVPLILILGILFSIGWYLFVYDSAFTRDILLHQARRLEDAGRHSASVWFYNLAYRQSGNDEKVAIELAEQFKEIGNYTKAEYTLAKAIENGGSVELYIALCKTYVEQDKLRDAVLMLDKIADPILKAELDALRPSAPTATVPSGQYAQYLSVEILSADCDIYASTDNDYPSTSADAYTQAMELGVGDTTIFAVSVGQNGLVSPLSVFQYRIDGVVEEVIFQDSVFEAALRQQLQIDPGHSLYTNDLWFVTEFTLPAGATSCADLKWLPQLKTLTITGGDFSDLQGLSGLTNLESLTITDSTLGHNSLEALSSLPTLRSLCLTRCGISSISGLAALTNLKTLDLSGNAIRNISALSAMTELEELNLSSNAIINIQELSGLTKLRSLDLSYNSLVSTAPICTLVNLQQLNISSNELRNLDGVEQLVKLEHFMAQHNQLLDVDALKDCTQLRYVDVSYNTLLNLDGLTNHKKLEQLNFAHNEVSTLPKFDKACALKVIDGSYNQLKSLDRLSGLKNLTHIYMDYNAGISNIDALVNCPVLEQVDVYGSKVRNVSKLTDKGILVNYTPR